MDVYGYGFGLTNAKIFATMQTMESLRLGVLHLSITFGFLFELKIILERFCTILNIKDKRMIQIDSITKEQVLYKNNI